MFDIQVRKTKYYKKNRKKKTLFIFSFIEAKITHTYDIFI